MDYIFWNILELELRPSYRELFDLYSSSRLLVRLVQTRSYLISEFFLDQSFENYRLSNTSIPSRFNPFSKILLDTSVINSLNSLVFVGAVSILHSL